MSETDAAQIDREARDGIGEAVLSYLTEQNPDWMARREAVVVGSVLDDLIRAHPELATSDSVRRLREDWEVDG